MMNDIRGGKCITSSWPEGRGGKQIGKQRTGFVRRMIGIQE
jgi:hypothetical protein